jgi:threonine dehydrogenase-like Zn-dependent dehydrogenase
MQALVVTPGEAHSTRVEDVPAVVPADGQVLLRTLEVGVCGTDREISEGLFGVAPEGEDRLVLGHEFLGVVEQDGNGFSRGDLVTGTVRRSCRQCLACEEGAPDACLTGRYVERGITRLHGYASELVAESPDQLIPIPRDLGRLGVLAEPSSICARGIRHALAVAGRQPWSKQRALVIGPGAIGMLATYLLRLEGFDTWTIGRGPTDSPKADLVRAAGAEYVSSQDTPAARLAEEIGGFDMIIEAAGDAQLMLDTLGLLRRNGVACLLGIDGHEKKICIDGPVLAVDSILQNRALIGSVNANRVDWEAAVDGLAKIRDRWPDALDAFVSLRTPPDRFEDAFSHRGVKATLEFSRLD